VIHGFVTEITKSGYMVSWDCMRAKGHGPRFEDGRGIKHPHPLEQLAEESA